MSTKKISSLAQSAVNATRFMTATYPLAVAVLPDSSIVTNAQAIAKMRKDGEQFEQFILSFAGEETGIAQHDRNYLLNIFSLAGATRDVPKDIQAERLTAFLNQCNDTVASKLLNVIAKMQAVEARIRADIAR